MPKDHGNRPIWIALPGLLTVAAALSVAALAAEEPPEAQPASTRVEHLVRKLAAPSYHERDLASDALEGIGPNARPALLDAAESEDLEMRLRARALLRLLRVSELWTPSHVDHVADGNDASEVIRALIEQTGNRLHLGDNFGSPREAPITTTLRGVPFWEAVDRVCRQSGNHIRPTYDPHRPGLVVVSGAPGQYPVAYSGPVRGTVVSARRVFIEELDLKTGDANITHTFQLTFQFIWEDRFRLVAYRPQPELLEALTDAGQELSATQPPVGGWNVISPSTRQLTMSLRLDPPEGSSTRLGELRLQLGLIAVGDMQTLVVDDLSADVPHRHGPNTLTVQKVEQKSSRWEITVLITSDAVLPEPQEIAFHENQFDVFDAENNPLALRGQSNYLTEDGVRMTLALSGNGSSGPPSTLHFSYPAIRSQRKLEMVFRDVPLPAARIK